MSIKKECFHCKKEFSVYQSILKRKGRGKFCSRKCFVEEWKKTVPGWNKGIKCVEMNGNTNGFKKGMISWNKGLKGVQVAWNKGKKWSKETKKKMSESHRTESYLKKMGGENSPSWKGGVTKKRNDFNYYSKVRRIRKAKLGGNHTPEQWQGLKERYGFMCLCCKKSEPEIKLTVDHIIPISRWKAYIQFHPEIKYQCGDIENIQPLCHSCNVRKHAKVISYIYEKK